MQNKDIPVWRFKIVDRVGNDTGEGMCLKNYATSSEINHTMRSILQYYYLEKEKEVRMFREQSVKQRLESLLKQFPGIFSCCSQKQVASYLGTSHEALCRVRAKR